MQHNDDDATRLVWGIVAGIAITGAIVGLLSVLSFFGLIGG